MKMASSQLEIVSSSPFGRVLRYQNRKERCRDNNVRSVFDRNLNYLVRDHINGCISRSVPQNSQNQISDTNVASWVTNEQANANANANTNDNAKSNANANANTKANTNVNADADADADADVNANANADANANDNANANANADVNANAKSNVNVNVNANANANANAKSNVKSNANANAKSKFNVNVNASPSTSPVIHRKSPVLDQQVTRQSQDVTLSAIDKHGNKAAEPLLVPSHSNTASTPNALAKHNLGASSLVQIWEARQNRSNNINSNHNQSQNMDSDTSITSSCVSCNENDAEDPSTSDLFEAKLENQTNNADSLTDWESQSQGGETASSSSCGRTSDAGTIERVRIADIINRLKIGRKVVGGHEHRNNENKHCSTSDEAQHNRFFSMVTNSPRLRGRQAFHDFLVQIDRDKITELDSIAKRQAVSKFSQRGRIQSMLRLKSLQHCLTIQDKYHSGNRLPQGSNIMHPRVKFSTGAKHLMTAQNVPATLRCFQKDKSSTCKMEKEDTHCKKGRSLTMNKTKDVDEHAKCLPTDAIQQKTSQEARCVEPLEIAKETTTLEGQSENEVAKEKRSNSQQHLLLGLEETSEKETATQIEIVKPEQEKDQLHRTIDLQETMDITTSLNSFIGNEIGGEEDICLDSRSHNILEKSSTISYINNYNESKVVEEEEEEDDYSQYSDETNDYDWFSNISRPKSYWEGLRKAWYQEVFNTTSTKEDIRQLLERGRVSTLLGSDFRESMDRLLTCHILQVDGAESQQGLDNYEEIRSRARVSSLISSDFLERMNRLMSSRVPIQQEDEAESPQKGKEEMVEPMSYQGVVEEEYEEERSLTSNQCQEEANNDFNHSSSSLQMPPLSALMMRSWSFQECEQGASGCSPPIQPSQPPCYQDSIQSTSSITHPSLEMELICDLRGHVEQLHKEINELRKSFVSYMDMQMKMQHYSLNHEDENSADTTPRKRSCCICHEMQVDSLLYRCGHMCTCLKCGHELQWRSGNCPICRAPILDVVPTK